MAKYTKSNPGDAGAQRREDGGYAAALAHFAQVDPVLAAVAAKVAPIEILVKPAERYYLELCQAIISQQLSDKVGGILCNRFDALFAGAKVTPAGVLAIADADLRQIGISNAKVRYMKDLAQHAQSELELDKLDTMDNDAVIALLTKVKGIGPWTAEMFLMFTLGRVDVFSAGDLGLRKAVQRWYELPALPEAPQLAKLTEPWSPYRTYASRVLWKSLEL